MCVEAMICLLAAALFDYCIVYSFLHVGVSFEKG